MADFEITVEIDESSIGEMIESIVNDDELLTEVNQILYEMCDEYVPYRTGKLANNVSITSGGVTYKQPYAESQYEGTNIDHSAQYHPLATAFWDEAMLRDHGDEFIAKVEEAVNRKAAEKYG